jgi:Ni/Co efflux regulator RcnB
MSMKYVMTAALALSLMASGAAFAQEHRDDRHEGGRPASGGGGPHGPPAGGAQHGAPPGAMGGPRPSGHSDRGPGPAPVARSQAQSNRGSGPAPVARSEAQFNRGSGGGRPGPGPTGPAPGSGFHGRPGGYLAGHGWNFNQRYRGPVYNYPRGFGYQYWAFGAFLPSVFLSQDYTLYNYWNYGLPPPPNGYHWIRVGPDALLVRYGDGYVLDAAYGLFY